MKIFQFCSTVTVILYFFVWQTVAQENPNKNVQRDKWKNINYNDIDKEWEGGDSKEELEHEFDRIQRIQAKKKPKINPEDPSSIKKAYDKNPFAFGGSGGAMIFVDVHKTKANGQSWKKSEVDTLAKKWTSLMKTGGLTASVYNTGDHGLLFNIDKGWLTKDVAQFIALQPEVQSFTYNNKKFFPKDFLNDDDDDL